MRLPHFALLFAALVQGLGPAPSSPGNRVGFRPSQGDGSSPPECGKDSDGKNKCALRLCCSSSGTCGTEDAHCGNGCQSDFGSCQIAKSPDCGKDSGTASKGRKIGYYQGWNTRNRKCNQVYPEHIKTEGLTHLYWGFASIDENSFEIVPDNPADPERYIRFTNLKQTGGLQTWISVGGWHFNEPDQPTKSIWAEMVSSHENRAKFINSVKPFLDKYGFQGIDLDWEWPVDSGRGGKGAQDTQNYVELVKELRAALGEQSKVGISAMLSSDYWYVGPILRSHTDHDSFIAYDLHGAWDKDFPWYGPKIRFHADIRDIHKNIQTLWFAGLDSRQVNLGIPYYGRGFTVSDKNCMTENCAFKGASHAGECTEQDGFLSNNEIWGIIREKNLKPELNKDAMQKQVTWDDQWIGFDDGDSIGMKYQYANQACLGGMMIWAVDFDSGPG
ncbi:glycoside hydrolase family 18 protein, partial [Lophiostoma macrostomum CBS 122681]